MYVQDTFYDVSKLTIKEKKDLLLDAKEKSFHWHIDKHDEHGVRQRIKYARFNTILKLLDKKSHYVFINRGGNLENYNKKSLYEFVLEIGFCTMGRDDGDYFLFINVNKKQLHYFIEKYKLLIL